MKTNDVIKRLFVSQTRQKLISIFFSQPNEMFYVRQLVRDSQEEINSVRRELSNLSQASIISQEARGNRLYYSVNKDNPAYHTLLVISHQIAGLGHSLQSSKVGNLKFALFSSALLERREISSEASIDMILVGDLNVREVDSVVKNYEQSYGREINYMIMDKSELRLRKQKRDPIIIDFFINCPSVIIGNPADFENF